MLIRKVIQRNLRALSFVGIFVLSIFVSVAQAEQPFDITHCNTGPAILLSSSNELTILGVDLKGIIMSNHENKVFDNFISHFVGVVRIMDGQIDACGYHKLTDPNGDFVFTEVTRLGPIGKSTSKLKLLYGTGKWKGITGSATIHPLTKRESIVEEETWRGCYRIIGTFELPK
jgi:hypothetical protein